MSLHKRERNLRLHKLTVEDRPRDAYAWYRFGDELRAVDRGEARAALERSWQLLLGMPPAERKTQVYAPEVPALLALLELDAGTAEGALAIANEGGAVAGWTPNLHYVRALVLERLAEHAGALAEYRWLLSFHGRRTEAPVQPGITGSVARLGCARALEAMEDFAGAEEALRGILALDPKVSRAARELARLLNSQGRAAEARGELDSYLKRAPHDGEAWALSGKLAFEAGSPEAALKRYQIAASAFDAPSWVLRELAVTQAIVGDFAAAVQAMERIPDADERKQTKEKIEALAETARK
jgi:tetratricopeptide (TPR) repeat protein